MKIIWITYISSWTPTLLNEIKKHIYVSVIIPCGGFKSFKHIENGITYYSLHLKNKEIKKGMNLKTYLKYKKVIDSENPHLIHVHGTETNFAQIQNYTSIPIVVSIQGILTGYIPFYNNYIRENNLFKYTTLKDILGYGGISNYYKNFLRCSSLFEEQLLTRTKYFFCRTKWDKAWISFSNPNALIFHGEELLRNVFYNNKKTWDVNKCIRHSIFMPSGINPIKGLYLAIKSLLLLKKYYYDTTLMVPGISYNEVYREGLKGLLIGDKYIRYIKSIIINNNLKDSVFFLGKLSADEMVQYMQKANVFLSPSSIDNSPNAIGEATMIGTPIVTTPVGGVPSFLCDNKSCLFAPAGDAHIMAYQIKNIFDDDKLAKELSDNATMVAEQRHNIENVTQAYIDSYNFIIKTTSNNV